MLCSEHTLELPLQKYYCALLNFATDKKLECRCSPTPRHEIVFPATEGDRTGPCIEPHVWKFTEPPNG